jgi:hypothetical protein
MNKKKTKIYEPYDTNNRYEDDKVFVVDSPAEPGCLEIDG